MKAIIFALGVLAPLFSYAQTEGKVVESCYAAADTDTSGLPEGTKVSIKIIQTGRNAFTASIEQVMGGSGQILRTQFPVKRVGIRSLPSWHYSNDERGFLNVYRTNKAARTPTGLNAHIRLFMSDEVFGLDRMECLAP